MSQSPDGPSRFSLIELIQRLRIPWRKVRPEPERPEPDRPVDSEKLTRAKLRVQIGIIRDAFDGEVAVASTRGPHRAKGESDAAYLFRPGHTLVRGDRIKDVMSFFERRGEDFEGSPEHLGEPVPGVVLLKVPARRDAGDDVLVTIEELEKELGRGDDVGRAPVASPDHVVYVTAIKAGLCPATEPEMLRHRRATPWPPATPSHGDVPEEDRVHVAVVDTGLWIDAVGSAESPWLEQGEVVADQADEEHVDPDAIHPYAGHGTFVAGVVRCIAPDATVEVEGVLTQGGAVYESAIVKQLQEAIEDDDRPQIISISAGTYTRSDFQPLGFELLGTHNELARREDILIVAAAGNDKTTAPFWPAAFDWVVGVGSVDADAKVSDFSNHGPDWVNVYARGRDLVNAFPKGTYKCYEPPQAGQIRTFDGLARWSGTSFSTPIVSGLIAAELRALRKQKPASVRAAWQAVLATAVDHHDTRINEDIKIVGPLT